MSWGNAAKKIAPWRPAWRDLRCWPWKQVWRDTSMTTTPRAGSRTPTTTSLPLAQIEQHLMARSRSSEARVTLERFGAAGAAMAGVHDLEGFLVLSRSRGKRVGRRNLRASLRVAPVDRTAALVTLALLRPSLGRMAATLTRRLGDREEAESAVVATAWALIRSPRSGQLAEPRPLIDAIWTELRRAHGLRRRGEPQLVPLLDLDLARDDEAVEDTPTLLDEALARGVLTFRQAWIVQRTRVADRPLTEVAAAMGQSYDAVRKERQRAEALLRAFAVGYRSSSSESM